MGESLCIGEHVVVTVLAVKGTQVRLGITAPRDVTVDREEVHERKLAKHRTEDGSGASDAEPAGDHGSR